MEKKKKTNKVLWSVIAFALAILSFSAIIGQSKELSISDLFTKLCSANPFWLLLAVACLACYILAESEALWLLLRQVGYLKTHKMAIVYSAADIYCAAITPSASGGQPACAWFLKRDKVPVGVISAVLLLYLICHSLATVTMGFICLLAKPGVFLHFSWLSKVLILFGYISLAGLLAFFFMLLNMKDRLYAWAGGILKFLHKRNLVKDPKALQRKLKKLIDDYTASAGLLRGSRSILLIIYLLNVLQRCAQLIISPIMYMATGGSFANFGTVFVMQGFTTVGSNTLPVPGGMGVADYILYDGLAAIMDKTEALSLELLSRSMSFYLLIVVSLFIVVWGYLRRKRIYITLLRK